MLGVLWIDQAELFSHLKSAIRENTVVLGAICLLLLLRLLLVPYDLL